MPNRALRYELLRVDGWSDITNDSSYYDNRHLPGPSNARLITTIDEAGIRSRPASIKVPGG